MSAASQWHGELSHLYVYSRSNLIEQKSLGQDGTFLLMHSVYGLIFCASNHPLFTGENLSGQAQEMAKKRRRMYAVEISLAAKDAWQESCEISCEVPFNCAF